MASNWIAVILVGILIAKPCTSLVYPSIHWTPRNPLFQTPEPNRVMNVQSMSRVNIICPNTATNVDVVQDNTPKEWLYENFWIVSKQSYDNCSVSSPLTDRLLLRCDTPLDLKYYTLIFLQYSATIQGLEFPVGKEYYFIATSDGTKASLSNSGGGNCLRSSMKMKFYVCKGPGDPRCMPQTTTTSIQANNQITNILTTTTIQLPKYTKPTLKTTDTNLIKKPVPMPPTTRIITTETDKALQSDDPKRTLEPTLQSTQPSTERAEEVTTAGPQSNIESLLKEKEECRHDHGTQPSWNVVIPLLVVISILVIMNSIVICRLKTNTSKACLDEDNLNKITFEERNSYHLRNNNRKTSNPVMV